MWFKCEIQFVFFFLQVNKWLTQEDNLVLLKTQFPIKTVLWWVCDQPSYSCVNDLFIFLCQDYGIIAVTKTGFFVVCFFLFSFFFFSLWGETLQSEGRAFTHFSWWSDRPVLDSCCSADGPMLLPGLDFVLGF